MKLWPCLVLAAGLLASCAARVDVRGVGSGGAPPFYELRGQRLDALTQRAAEVCPDGYRVARRWQHRRAAESGSGPVSGARLWLEDALFPGAQDQAQLVIQCQSGPPPFEPLGLPLPARAVGAAPVAPASPQPVALPEPQEAAARPVAPAASASPAAPALPSSPAGRNAAERPLPGAPAPARKSPPGRVKAASPFSVPSTDSQGRGAM